ncbi:MAG: PEP-CTERM sorting domain-containing protein [candidate division Zixibacteria bacterium]|nr:PEP-CTERM sorting domain-containing protein [candidate division Zixibacteria bacterium]
MKKLFMIALMVMLTASSSYALTTLDFENISQDHWYYEGAQNLGSYYEGVHFGPTATILENQVYGFGGDEIPTRSGQAVLFSSFDIGIQADFDSYANHVQFYYGSYERLCFFIYDEDWNLMDHLHGNANPDLEGFMEYTSDDYNIAHVRIAAPRYMPIIIDDFGFETLGSDPVPEPGTVLLLAAGLLGVAGINRARKKL